jgi:HD-GYP domain-containing protein (c-di-GMP phosphodiesterase class II)
VRLSAIFRLEAGAVLARDVPTGRPDGIPLLRSGVALTPRYLRALGDAGIYAVWIEDSLSEGIEPESLIPEEVRQSASASVARALSAAEVAIDRDQPLAYEVIDDLTAVAEMIAREIANCPDAAMAIADLAVADAYTHTHSVDVTGLGMLLGRRVFSANGWVDHRGERRYDRVNERLSLLGLGLLLHDIGKMTVPHEVLHKPAKLDADEWKLIRGHPEAGVAMLATDSISPLVKDVVRSHHERWNGSGYPRGLYGDDIGQFARIAAIADVYDAITSERPYRGSEPAYVGVQAVRDGSGSLFDPEMVTIFRRTVAPYPPGSEITLPDGRVGVVAEVKMTRPERPLVRIPTPSGAEEVVVDVSGPTPVLAEAAVL